MKSFYRKLFILPAALLLFACAGDPAPSTPLETLKAYTQAIKRKDPTMMKVLLSAESLKMHRQEAQAQNVTLDEVVLRETLFAPDQKTLKFRNEKIEGDRATIEVQNSYGTWQTVPFVKEEDGWKLDKQSFANQIEQLNQQSNDELDRLINQGSQP